MAISSLIKIMLISCALELKIFLMKSCILCLQVDFLLLESILLIVEDSDLFLNLGTFDAYRLNAVSHYTFKNIKLSNLQYRVRVSTRTLYSVLLLHS